MLPYMILTIVLIIITSFLTYHYIAYKSINFVYTTLVVLKDVDNSEFEDNVDIKDFDPYHKVTIERKEMYIFGKLEKTEIYLNKERYIDIDFNDRTLI